MQKCRLNGEPVYAFDVIKVNNVIDYKYEKMLREASEKGQLKCDDCNSDIVFKFGKIKKPHFAHKSSTTGGCGYFNESEEHIKGNKLLLDIMRREYPSAQYEMRYRFKSGKRADLFFRFDNDKELAIEFQRDIASILKLEEKKAFYLKEKINNVWFLSGKSEEFECMLNEIYMIFQQRLVMNETGNKLYILDVDREEIIIVSKITIINEDTQEVEVDRLFNKTYKLNDIKILQSGEIQCDFNKIYEEYKVRIIKSYEEEKFKNEEIEKVERSIDEKVNLIEDKAINKKNDSSITNNNAVCKLNNNEAYFRKQVNNAINGNNQAINGLIRKLARESSDDYEIIKKILEDEVRKETANAKHTFEYVISKSKEKKK